MESGLLSQVISFGHMVFMRATPIVSKYGQEALLLSQIPSSARITERWPAPRNSRGIHAVQGQGPHPAFLRVS